MSLFSRLLKLHAGSIPLEDFFTELVAHLFSTNKEILGVAELMYDIAITSGRLRQREQDL